MIRPLCALLLLLCSCATTRALETPQDWDRAVETFTLPEPTTSDRSIPDLWATWYLLWPAVEQPAGTGFALLDPDEKPFPANAPIWLTGHDWCQAALQGSANVTRLDGSVLTVNYATQSKTVALDCGDFLNDARWRTQGTVRFGKARGPYGDGVKSYALVPFRSIAVDKRQTPIPYGTAVFVPSARGVAFTHAGESFVHDGWFFAADTGGAIQDLHIDVFLGTTRENPLPFILSSADKARFEARLDPTPSATTAALARAHSAP